MSDSQSALDAGAKGWRWAKIAAATAAGLSLFAAIILAAVLYTFNSGWGRSQIAAMVSTSDGISLADIDGSLFGTMTLRDLQLSDDEGVWLRMPRAQISWSPWALMRRQIKVKNAVIARLDIMRAPENSAPEAEPKEAPRAFKFTDITDQVVSIAVTSAAITEMNWRAGTDQSARAAFIGKAELKRASSLFIEAHLRPTSIEFEDEVEARILLQTAKPFADIFMRLDAQKDGLLAGLSGLAEPVKATLQGKGTPQQWSGRMDARFAGQPITKIDAAYADNRGNIKGFLDLSPAIDSAAVPALATPFTIDTQISSIQEGRQRINGNISNTVLKNTVLGIVVLDLNAPRLEDFLISSYANGDLGPVDVNALVTNIVLNGGIESVTLNANMNAASLHIGDIAVQGIGLKADAQQAANEIALNLKGAIAAVDGISGLDRQILSNVAINGHAIQPADGGERTANLTAQNDLFIVKLIDAEQSAAGDLSARITAQLPSLSNFPGALDAAVSADIRLTQPANEPLNVITSTVLTPKPKTEHWVAGLASRDLKMTARAALDESAIILRSLKVTSDQVKISASGSLMGDTVDAKGQGKIGGNVLPTLIPEGADFNLRAAGPLATVLPTGTAQLKRLSAADLAFENIALELMPTSTGDAATALRITGNSNAGPVNANARIQRFKDGGLSVERLKGQLANVSAQGNLLLPAGSTPEGQLTLGISQATGGTNGLFGLSGDVTFQADMGTGTGTGNAIAITGGGPVLTYGSSDAPVAVLHDISLNSAINLGADVPQVTADLETRAVEAGGLFIDKITLNAQSDANAQRATLSIDQNTARPTAAVLDATAQQRDRILDIAITPSGRLAGEPFRSDVPIHIQSGPVGLTVDPATLTIGGGSLELQRARIGDSLAVVARVKNIALRTLTDILDKPSYAGTFSGDVTLEASAQAKGLSAAINVDGLANPESSADPVSLQVTAQADEKMLQTRVTEGSGSGIRSLKGALDVPIAWQNGGGLFAPLEAAPLNGTLKLETQLAPWWALANLPDQALNGLLGVDIAITGTAAEPIPTGTVTLSEAGYENFEFGAVLTDLRAALNFNGEEIVLKSLTAQDGRGGTLAASARIDVASQTPTQSQIQMKDFQLLETQDLGARADADLSLVSRQNGLGLKGDIKIAEARYAIATSSAASVPTLPTQEININALPPELQPKAAQQDNGASSLPPLDLDIQVKAPRRIFVTGLGLTSEWQTTLDVDGSSDAPNVVGQISLVRGELDFAGKRFALERGQIFLDGAPEVDPRLDLLAENTQGDFTARIGITGTPANPTITLSSTPTLPDDEILSRILFGTSATDLSALEAVQLASAVAALSGGGGSSALDIAGKARSATGLDRLSLGSSESSTSITGGKYLSPNVYLQFTTDPSNGQYLAALEWYVTRTLSLLSQYGAETGSNVAARWSRNY